jgi:hypothetical protein
MRRQLFGLAAVLVVSIPLGAGGQNRAPRVSLDPSWPKMPLRDRWVLGQIGGVCVDAQDHVFIENRGVTDDTNLDAGINAPPIIELDPEGNIVNGWGDLKTLGGGHGCAVDAEGNVWVVAGGGVRKFTHDGKLLTQVMSPEGKASYTPQGVAIDPQNGDAYIVTDDAQHRILVVDRSGKSLRQFHANRAPNEAQLEQVLHCIGFSKDGLVYICDRRAYRVQVFDRMGTFQKNEPVPWKPYTSPEGRKGSGGFGSASALAFSPDASQQFIFTTNEDNSQIEIVDRKSGDHLGSFGYGAGTFPGQFQHVHGIAVDSKGNIYTAEVGAGTRVQKWKIAR